MRKPKLTRAVLAGLVLLSGISDQALADKVKAPSLSAGDTFTFVPSDAVLKQMGHTRAQYNAGNRKAERRWRGAWAAKGTSHDTRTYGNIRAQTQGPKDEKGDGH